MVEKIYEEFNKKRAEVLKQPEFKEGKISPEKEKEILKEAISEQATGDQAVAASDDQQQTTTAQRIQTEPKERQIDLLVDLAFEKSISHAIEVAKRLDNPYLLDEFHDALVDELYNKLIKEGKLKQI